MAKNVAVGILRPPKVFFYEVDVKSWRKKLIESCNKRLTFWSLFRTRRGYHIIGFPFTKSTFRHFKRNFPSDFAKHLKPRWRIRDPQVLRISEKWDLKTGKVVSPKPKFICGNFFLEGIMDYKVLYYAK